MASKIILKKSSVAAKVPLTSDLEFGELALNYTDGKLFYKTASNTIDSFTSGIQLWTKKTTTYTAVNGDKIIADTTGGSFTITLPASPATGHFVEIVDGGDWTVNNLTIARNGSTIEGSAEDLLIDVKGVGVSLVYDGTTWEITPSVGIVPDSQVTFASVQTLSNKRITPRVNNNGATTSGTITPTGDLSDQYEILGLTNNITIDPPSGTPVAGQRLTLRIKDNGAVRSITWNTSAGGYRAVATILPNLTVAGENMYVGCIYNATDNYWDVIAVAKP